MDPKPEETPEERERLLAPYDARDRELIEETVACYPDLSIAKAIEILHAFGGL